VKQPCAAALLTVVLLLPNAHVAFQHGSRPAVYALLFLSGCVAIVCLTCCIACRVQLHNVTPADVAAGLQEYLKYGAGTLKKKTALTPCNIFDKAALFTEMHLDSAPMGQLNFPQTLLTMIRTGNHYAAGWILPGPGRGLSHERAGAQWRLQTSLETAQPEDVHRSACWLR
jgi:hypothetical protein